MKITFTKEKNPVLTIPENIYNTMLSNVRSTDLEITFILEIERRKNNPTAFTVKSFQLPPQWNEPAESKTIDSQYPKWCVDKVKQGIKLNGHGHTHPKMGVTPSGYDINFFKELEKDTNTFQFRFILNQKGLIQCDLIDKEEGYIAEQMDVVVPCEGFNLIINSTNHTIVITDTKKLSIISIDNSLKVTLASELIAVSANAITNTIIEKEELIKTQRRNETDEAIKTYGYTNPNQLPYSNKKSKKSAGSEDTDDYLDAYYKERGYYGL